MIYEYRNGEWHWVAYPDSGATLIPLRVLHAIEQNQRQTDTLTWEAILEAENRARGIG